MSLWETYDANIENVFTGQYIIFYGVPAGLFNLVLFSQCIETVKATETPHERWTTSLSLVAIFV